MNTIDINFLRTSVKLCEPKISERLTTVQCLFRCSDSSNCYNSCKNHDSICENLDENDGTYKFIFKIGRKEGGRYLKFTAGQASKGIYNN